MTDRQPEREYDATADAVGSYYAAVAVIGEMVRAGETLHPLHRTLFVPQRERGGAE